MNRKQERYKVLFLLCLCVGIGATAYWYHDHLCKTMALNEAMFVHGPYSYRHCEIYSSLSGQYYVSLKFLIPCEDERQEESLNKNMLKIRDFIYTNISSDTDLGNNLKKMDWKAVKDVLIEEINHHTIKPVQEIYFQECIIASAR